MLIKKRTPPEDPQIEPEKMGPGSDVFFPDLQGEYILRFQPLIFLCEKDGKFSNLPGMFFQGFLLGQKM